MEDAVAFAFVNTEKDKICLLSTASPSYSVWKNFEEKGDLFKASIKKIAEENTLPKKEDDR
jgi:UDP-N-acetylmuramoylalanine--D-glutamate ligase